MIKKRLSLSLVAMVGSLFLFVAASFAWFTISDIVNIGENVVGIQNIDVTAELYVSDNGADYDTATSIDFQNSIPGDIKYYKLLITNNNVFDISTQVSLHGFTDAYTDLSGDTSNYSAGRSLNDILLLNTSNNVNSDTIVNQTLTSLILGSSLVITHEDVVVSASGTAELFFSFTVSETLTGNDYQNLRLDIDNLYVQSVD